LPPGAAHHDDLIYLFGVTASFSLIAPSDSEDSKLVDKMTAIWYNFARYGDPNPKGDTPEISALLWPVIKPDSRKYLRIEKDFSVHENLFEDRFKVWEELYPLPN
ncbi:carboxylesterase 5A-like, partial [Manduca sexta]|uniref:carboxylesterase 5A-like n=1 Tax=Manduca sexta TaxID=7130 RepID=UPI00188E8264